MVPAGWSESARRRVVGVRNVPRRRVLSGDNLAADEVLRGRLAEPYVSAETAHIALRAIDNQLPVFLCGEAGTGKRTLARALHECGAGGSFLDCPARSFADDPLLPPPKSDGGTLYLDRIELLTDPGQDRLASLLDSSGRIVLPGGPRLRLISASECPLDKLVDENRFPTGLYYRVTVLPFRLLPLHQRPADIPALAEASASDLCRSLGLPPTSFTPAALESLTAHPWYGNLAELESVLARTIALRRLSVLDAGDLLFEGTAGLQTTPTAPQKAKFHPKALSGPTLELILNELAHELRNPMVTVKTFAQLAERLLNGQTDHSEMVRLTGEAIDRMDEVLENLLAFARFGEPRLEPVPLATLVAEPTAELRRLLAEHENNLASEKPPSITVLADAEQSAYALSSLFTTFARDLAKGSTLSLRYAEPATITLHVPPENQRPESKLAGMICSQDAAAPALPLGVAIAQSLVERNGGEVLLDRAEGTATVTIRFAPAELGGEEC